MRKFPSAFLVMPIYYNKKKRKKERSIHLKITIEGIKIKGKIMAISLKDTQIAEVELLVVDKKGHATTVDEGSVTFSSSDQSIFMVEEDPDNDLKAKIIAVSPGVAQLDYSADADLEEGLKTINGFTAVEVLPGEAFGFGIRVTNIKEQETSTSTSTTFEDVVTTTETSTEAVTETTTEVSVDETTTEVV